MSDNVFSKCVAIELVEPITNDELFDTLYDYLEKQYDMFTYSIRFGNDFITLYQDNDAINQYGITRINGSIKKENKKLFDILVKVCQDNGINAHLKPKYFTDFWYNGCDCSTQGMNWKDL